jgi:mRNA interferase HigB
MHVITERRLREFWKKHAKAKEPMKVWLRLMRSSRLGSTHEVKELFGQTDFLGDGLAVFDIGGNKYRIVARILYPVGRVLILGVFDHKGYDDWTRTRQGGRRGR